MTKPEKFSYQKLSLVILAIGLFLTVVFAPFQDLINYRQTGNNLFAAIQFKYNFYFYLTSFGLFLASDYGSKVLLLISICCSYLVLNRLYSDNLKTLIATLSSWLLIMQIFNLDYVVLATLCFCNLFFLCLEALKKLNTSTASLFLLTCLTAWLCLLNFALISLILGLLTVVLFEKYQSLDSLKFPSSSKILIVIAFTILFIANAVSPSLPYPDYPATARLTQIFDAPAWYARPLIGPDNQIPSLDRLSLREQLGKLILPSFLGILALFIRYRQAGKHLLFSGCLLLLFCDLRLPESYSQILPLQGISRLLPGISDISVTPILFACFIFYLTFLLIQGFKSGIFIFLALSAFLAVSTKTAAINCIPQFQGSPSCLVAAFFTPEVLNTAKSEFKKFKPKKDDFILTSSNQNSTTTELIDRDASTRWSSRTGKQTGNEWLQLSFDKAQTAIGLDLQTGNFATDFPRGIELKVGNSCNEQDLRTIATYSNWQGFPVFTENGFPFFSAQSDVKIFFEKSEVFSCLKISQTGLSDNFDWSISEFRLLIAKDKITTSEENSID